MKRYDTTTPAQAVAEPREPGPAGQVAGALIYSTGASVAILSAGGLFLLAADRLTWGYYRFAVMAASLPAGVVGALLVLASWRYSVALLETLTGVDIDHSGAVGDVVRLVSFRGSGKLIDSGGHRLPEADLKHFIEQGFVIGTTQANWRGSTMPSGRKCNTNYHKALMDVLTGHGLIEGVRKGAAGHWSVGSAREALDALGLTEATNLD